MDETVVLDVGGTIFKTYKKTLTRHSGYFRALFDFKNDKRIFIDRDPVAFRAILNCFRNNTPIPMEYYDEADYYMCDVAVNRLGVVVVMNDAVVRLPEAHYAGLYVECEPHIDNAIVINGVVIPLCVVRPVEKTYCVLKDYHGALEISHNFATPLIFRKQTCDCSSADCASDKPTKKISTFVETESSTCYNVMAGYPNAAFLIRLYPQNFSHAGIDVIYGARHAGARHYERVSKSC